MPPHNCFYPLSLAEQQAMEEYVQEVLQQGYIQPSTCLSSAGFFFVEKKVRGLCPCIDYQGLIQIAVKYRYPLPLVPSALEQLCSMRIFTKLDLCSAYNFVSIREGDEWKTEFSTIPGHFEYCVMLSEFSCTPSVFLCLINDVLTDMLGKFAITYINDILIYSPSV